VVSNSAGSVNSNAVTLTVNAIPTYIVIVTNGTGGGSFEVGATVTVTANAAPAGQVFDKWVTSDGVALANANNKTTTFTMLSKAVTVIATYKPTPAFDEHFTNIDPEGKGEAIIRADAGILPDGSTFEVKYIMPPPPEVDEKAKDQLGASTVIIAYYEIRLFDSDGNQIYQLDGEITIGTKLPDGYENGTGVSIHMEDADGILVKMTSWVEDGFIFIKTDWLERY